MTTNPLNDSNVPYFKKYTDLVPSDTILTILLRVQHQGFIDWLNAVPELDSTKLHPPYTWTLGEVIQHLSDCERVFAFRAFWIARGGPLPLPSFDENEFSKRGRAMTRSLAQLITEFHSVRESSVTLFDSFSKTDWETCGQVSDFEISIEQQATIIIGHVAHHWNILQKRFG